MSRINFSDTEGAAILTPEHPHVGDFADEPAA